MSDESLPMGVVGKFKWFYPNFGRILLLVFLVVACANCRRSPLRVTPVLAGFTMGTTYSIKVVPVGDGPTLAMLSNRIQAELERVNDQMSTYLKTSEISQFNQSRTEEWFPVSRETAEVVQQAVLLAELSQGAFDVTVGPLVNLWGFGPDRRPEHLPTPEQVEEIKQHTGYQLLEARLDPPGLRKLDAQVQIDLSAIAKGHGVDRVAKVLEEVGVLDYFIEIGGEVRVGGKRQDARAWRVGIERPVETDRDIQEVLELSDGQSLATSGNYRNFYRRDGMKVAHTIDPRTGYPVKDRIASASVVAESCALADARATTMMSLGFEKGMQLAEQQAWAVLLIVPTRPDDGGPRTPAGQEAGTANDSQPQDELAGEEAFQILTSSQFRRLFPRFEAASGAH